VLRLLAMKISTIETLFSLRSNPFLLARADAFQAALLLVLLAMLMWSIQIAVNFPTAANRTTFSVVDVPTLNVSVVSLLHYGVPLSLLIRLDRLVMEAWVMHRTTSSGFAPIW
jgi:hypothetical protein